MTWAGYMIERWNQNHGVSSMSSFHDLDTNRTVYMFIISSSERDGLGLSGKQYLRMPRASSTGSWLNATEAFFSQRLGAAFRAPCWFSALWRGVCPSGISIGADIKHAMLVLGLLVPEPSDGVQIGSGVWTVL